MKPKKKKNKPQNSKPRFCCDPGVCNCCQYIGDGDFLCDEHQAIVVADWEPTEDYMTCRRRRKSNG